MRLRHSCPDLFPGPFSFQNHQASQLGSAKIAGTDGPLQKAFTSFDGMGLYIPPAPLWEMPEPSVAISMQNNSSKSSLALHEPKVQKLARHGCPKRPHTEKHRSYVECRDSRKSPCKGPVRLKKIPGYPHVHVASGTARCKQARGGCGRMSLPRRSSASASHCKLRGHRILHMELLRL